MEGSERRARARIANKPARYFDDDDSDEPPVKRARDGGGEVRSRRDPAGRPSGSASDPSRRRRGGRIALRPFFSPRLRPGEGVGDPKGCWTRCARRASPSSRDRAGECAMPPGLIDTRAAPAISNASASSAAFSDVPSSRRAVSGRAPTDDARDATGAVRRRRRWRSRGRLATRGWSRWSRWGSSNAPRATFPRSEGSPNAARLLHGRASSPTARRR